MTRGYTLLEMLLVVLILGMLTSIVAPRMVARTDHALAAKARTDLARIAQSLSLYRLDAGAFPTTTQGLAALVELPAHEPVPASWNPQGYLDRVPEDPWGRAYHYRRDSPQRFTLLTLGADGQAGGTGPARDILHGDAPS